MRLLVRLWISLMKWITEYIDLLIILRVNDYNLFKVACDNTILFTNVVRSLRHSENKRKRF